jgi:hypothetical protein
MSNPSAKQPKSVHQKFAERSQMLRWFNERSMKELKAMRKGYELMLAHQTRTGGTL